jgi:hypothetical protein
MVTGVATASRSGKLPEKEAALPWARGNKLQTKKNIISFLQKGVTQV